MAINSTTDKDTGASRIINEAATVNGSFVEIGVHESAGMHEGEDEPLLTVAEVAFFNEFGTVTAPERSFLRSTIDENRRKLEKKTAELFSKVESGRMDAKKALDALGFLIQELIRKKILETNDPPNAPRTIAAKGFNNPLVDSRQLWRSITFESTVKRKKGGKVA